MDALEVNFRFLDPSEGTVLTAAIETAQPKLAAD